MDAGSEPRAFKLEIVNENVPVLRNKDHVIYYYNGWLFWQVFRLSLFFQIVVQVRDEGNGWIVGRTGSVEGAFPASYVEQLRNNGPE